jgi:hypothetical protein
VIGFQEKEQRLRVVMRDEPHTKALTQLLIIKTIFERKHPVNAMPMTRGSSERRNWRRIAATSSGNGNAAVAAILLLLQFANDGRCCCSARCTIRSASCSFCHLHEASEGRSLTDSDEEAATKKKSKRCCCCDKKTAVCCCNRSQATSPVCTAP